MMVFAMPPQRYVTMILNPLLIGVAAIFLVLSANDLIKLHRAGNVVSAQPHPTRRISQPPSISGTQPRSYYDVIVQRDIFNLTPATAASTVTTKEDLQIKLLGTSHVTDDKPFLIVEDSGGNELVYRLGDAIPNAGRIIEVWQDRAVILHDNHRVTISIPQDRNRRPGCRTCSAQQGTATHQQPGRLAWSPSAPFEHQILRLALPPTRSDAQQSLTARSVGGSNMKMLAVLSRAGHQLDDDRDTCLAFLRGAGICAHFGRPESERNILWIEINSDLDRAVTLLRADGFQVSEHPWRE
jgi:hypothetical protein